MNHIELADKKRVRHHASKNFKKYSKNPIKNRMINTEEPTKEDMEVIKEMCKMWFNGFDDSAAIEKIMNALDKCSDKYEKELVLKPIYWNIASKSDKFKKGCSRALFTYNFIIGAPYFKQWIAEEKRSKAIDIKGELEIEILDIFEDRKKVKVNEFYKNVDNFESVIDGVLTKMVKKGIFEVEYSKYGELYYNMCENVKYDSVGYYLE